MKGTLGRALPLVDSASETCMVAIQSIRAQIPLPLDYANKIREAARSMQMQISALKKSGLQDDSPELTKLNLRLEVIAQLTNEMECGDLMILGDRALQAAYRRLP